MAKLTGSIVDEATGERVEARVQVLASTGSFVHPSDAILKVGPGAPFFYSAKQGDLRWPSLRAR